MLCFLTLRDIPFKLVTQCPQHQQRRILMPLTPTLGLEWQYRFGELIAFPVGWVLFVLYGVWCCKYVSGGHIGDLEAVSWV